MVDSIYKGDGKSAEHESAFCTKKIPTATLVKLKLVTVKKIIDFS